MFLDSFSTIKLITISVFFSFLAFVFVFIFILSDNFIQSILKLEHASVCHAMPCYAMYNINASAFLQLQLRVFLSIAFLPP